MSTVATTDVTAKVACAHCGLPAAGGSDSQPSFCCPGCRGAYALIRGWGLEEFYELRDSTGEEVGVLPEDAFEDLDDPRLLGRSAPVPITTDADRPLVRSCLAITGLHCAACAWLIERASEQVCGWHSARVSMHSRTIEIVWDPRSTRLSQIAGYLHRIGYRLAPLNVESKADADSDARRDMLVAVAFAGFCAANAMWIAIALYAGQFSGMSAAHAQLLRWAGVGLGLAAVIFPGRVFFRSALASIQTRTPHMDLPVAVGLTAGLAASLYALVDANQEVYFDSIACLVFFLLTGRWLQMSQQHRAGEAVAALVRLSPPLATRVDDHGNNTRVPTHELSAGETIVVRPGESVPVDGVVVTGDSLVDRSLLTGESCPVSVTNGSVVEAGTDKTQSDLRIRVTAVGEETRLAGITRAVAEAAESRTPIVQLANRIGAWFVVSVLALAVFTGLLWYQIDSSRVLPNVVALLIVACPCALALATPLAIAVSIGRLAKRDVLVRRGDCLERLKQPGILFFDKTGTLTQGRMKVTSWCGERHVLADIAGIERGIHHPIAHAIVHYAADQPMVVANDVSVCQVRHEVGQGVDGRVGDHHYKIGSVRLLARRGTSISPALNRELSKLAFSGESPVVVIRDGICVAVIGIADPLREDAVEVTNTLKKCGWEVKILSGDHQSAVNAVASQLGIENRLAHGDFGPEEKLSAIRDAVASEKGPVLMVGDGVNDAAALAAADVGIAIRGGARASLAAAPVVIKSGKLDGVLELTESAGRTRRTIGRNFAISIGYNLIAVALAMSGWITPLIAAALMPISSLSVLALTLADPKATE